MIWNDNFVTLVPSAIISPLCHLFLHNYPPFTPKVLLGVHVPPNLPYKVQLPELDPLLRHQTKQEQGKNASFQAIKESINYNTFLLFDNAFCCLIFKSQQN